MSLRKLLDKFQFGVLLKQHLKTSWISHLFVVVCRHELHSKWTGLLKPAKFYRRKDRADLCLLHNPCSFFGREFLHWNNSVQNTNYEETDKLFRYKHGHVRLAVFNFFFPHQIALLYKGQSWLVGSGFGLAMCKFLPFLSDTSTIVSVQSLILIAVDRFGAVSFLLRSPLMTLRLCPFFILATWVIAMAYHSPYLFVHKLVEYQGKLTCEMRWKETFGDSSSLANYFLAGFIVFIYLPIVLLAMLYSKIFVKLRSQAHPGEQSTNTEEQRTRRNNSVLKMAIAIVLGFVICGVPFTVTVLLQVFAWNRSIPCSAAHYVTFTRFLAYANCAINPFICFTFSSNYRKGLKKLIHCFSSAAVLPA